MSPDMTNWFDETSRFRVANSCITLPRDPKGEGSAGSAYTHLRFKILYRTRDCHRIQTLIFDRTRSHSRTKTKLVTRTQLHLRDGGWAGEHWQVGRPQAKLRRRFPGVVNSHFQFFFQNPKKNFSNFVGSPKSKSLTSRREASSHILNAKLPDIYTRDLSHYWRVAI